MDLTKLYNLTTPELRAEAERLGVPDSYALSRAQLIHAIRSQTGDGDSEGFFGRMIGLAKWALKTTSAPPDAPPEKAPGNGTRDASADDAVPGPVAAKLEESLPDPGPQTRPTEPSLATGAFYASAPPPSSEAAQTPSSRAPAGVFSGSKGLFEEPFPTRTMARILAEQGHYKRSLAIYASLVEEAPDDPELRGEFDRVRTRSRERRATT